MHRCAGLFGILLVCLTATWSAAESITLRTGETVYGEIIDIDLHTIRIRTQVHGRWVNVPYRKDIILEFDEEPGDQSDHGMPVVLPEDALVHDDRAVVVVIPLHGVIGWDGVENSIFAAQFEHCLEEAKAQNAALIVLDVESPGGYVTEMEAICEMIIECREDVPVIAYVRDALSAAAIITMTCPKVYAHPQARIGAAVMITDGENGIDAVDAKFASPHHAKQRRYMESSGHPYDVVKAMTIQDTELWWSPTGGFRTTEPKTGDDWEHVDTESTVLTMTAQQAKDWEIVTRSTRLMDNVINDYLGHDDYRLVPFEDTVLKYNRETDRRLEQLFTELVVYFQSLDVLLVALQQMSSAFDEGNAQRVHDMRKVVNQYVTRSNKARRRIMKIERIMFQHSFDEPDAVLLRIEADAQILNKVRSHTRSENPAAFNKIVDDFNSLLAAWREIMAELDEEE
ncbi:MAG: ATP-dependent Clp protease proteolytic subunit [Planctomycetota bacterium]